MRSEFSEAARINRFQNIIKNITGIIPVLFITFLFMQCRKNERFRRPDLPEQLCTVGIIDIDDTINYKFSIRNVRDLRNSTRYVTFEKSFQSEYAKPGTDSLSEFEFGISSDYGKIFNYQNPAEIKSPLKFEFPDTLNFNSGETYFLNAKVGDMPEISASSTVPDPPTGFTLDSYKKEEVTLHLSSPCWDVVTASSVVFDVAFTNANCKRNYYMILFIADGMFMELIPYSGPVDFSVRQTNTPGFFSEILGLNTLKWECITDESGPYSTLIGTYLSHVSGYYIDGSRIPGDSCKIRLSVQYNDKVSPLISLHNARIKLLSIPEEFYFFEKNLHNYAEVRTDPFSEPVYLMGNIKNGNGVFAICRSSNLDINFVTGF